MTKRNAKRAAVASAAIALVALTGCTSEPEPKWTPTSGAETPTATPTPTPTPTSTAKPGLDKSAAPTSSEEAMQQANAFIEDTFLPRMTALSTEAAPVESMTEYVVPGSQAEQVVADTVRMNKEMNASIVGDGQFRWGTAYTTSYVSVLTNDATDEKVEFGSVALQGCLYNEGLTYMLNGQVNTDVSTDPTRRQYTVVFNPVFEHWQVMRIDQLTEQIPC